ncbi:hypothetical protein METBIDRAFT_11928 [Metschnikowia bicuspidata var. bicuspidata NRRL YB-4993]|uniref:Uncharacterized protein n=1 Tax=Metschnikowia bicuspidata var. bicuspidata NRRL YB-4993 TaxID=869754 RepID=A0A1A0HBQ0_9ASCO|nr:hypothetical protein METBIDRAFT_11928 [Metschnikowia bicuspidata var. bicuspidata NRRL YB-4993]OBA21410.1 hypothetical protein METBIDRAFT_11928 [Metschnikowia bicuspidata var. bicuspidata NRRL YB-4993]
MADALERDIKKEKANQTPTSVALREPALLFNYVEDKTKSLYDQLSEHLSQPRFDTVKLELQSGLASPDANTSTLAALKLPSDSSCASTGYRKMPGDAAYLIGHTDDYPISN